MLVNNLGVIVLSVGGKRGSESLLLVLFSAANAVGRVGYGLLSDRLLAHVPRAMFLVLSSLIICINCFAFLALQLRWLPVFVLTAGIAFGGLFNTIPCLVGELYGLKHYGANWGIMILAPALGAVGYSLLAGRLYDGHASGASKSCVGRGCFALAFFIAGVSAALAALLSLVAARRTAAELASRTRHSTLSAILDNLRVRDGVEIDDDPWGDEAGAVVGESNGGTSELVPLTRDAKLE